VKGIKHILECHCILPQYRDRREPVYHKFIVFSEIDESDTVVPSNVQCNNCGTVHKIYDLCKSEIVAGKDESASVEKKEDVALSLPKQLVSLLETYSLEICDYQLARHIIENKQWDSTLVLSMENEGETSSGKILRFLAEDRFRVESFSRQELL
tara:strand:- start:124 stop:585 length:462 start_codon:yes stop_codon:yes gene_type:complete